MNPLDYVISGHSSVFFLYLFGWVERLFPGQLYPFNIFQIFFGFVGVWTFCLILEDLLKPCATRTEIFIYGLIYAFHPAILSSCINFNVDEGVLVFFLLYWWAYLRNKFNWATLFAIMMLFSKENGVLLYPLPLFANFLHCVRKQISNKNLSDWRPILKDWIRKHAILILLPTLVYGFYLTFRMYLGASHRSSLLYEGVQFDFELLNQFINPFRLTNITLTYLIEAFLINFNWSLTLFLIVTLCLGLYAHFIKKSINKIKIDPIVQPLVILMFTAYLLTRYQTVTNIRYIIPIFPLLILCTAQSSAYMIPFHWIRIGISALILSLTLVGLTHSVDPISNKIFGIFRFGNHPMLKMTSITGECCGFGRDQLIYNLEFTKFNDIQNRIYADIKPTNETIILLSPAASFDFTGHLLTGSLDKQTYHRSLGGPESFTPQYWVLSDLMRQQIKPKEIFYIHFPNIPTPEDLINLSKLYSESSHKIYEIDDYQLEVVKFKSPISFPFPKASL